MLTVGEDDGTLLVPVTQLLANDSDPDAGDAVTVIAVGASNLGAAIGFENGQIVYGIGDAKLEAFGSAVVEIVTAASSESRVASSE